MAAVSPAGGTDLTLSPSSTAANCNCASSPAHGLLSPAKSSESSKSSKSPRNTVHWGQDILDPSVKENTDPESHQNKASAKASPKGFQWTLDSEDLLLDLSDKNIRGQRRRPQLAAETFTAPEVLAESIDTLSAHNDSFGDHELVRAARGLNPQENTFEKHRKKQFQWVLSLPASVCSTDQPSHSSDRQRNTAASCVSSRSDRRYFGCNLLTWTKTVGSEEPLPGEPEDEYLLLATPIDLTPDEASTGDLEITSHRFRVLGRKDHELSMATARIMSSPASAAASGHGLTSSTPESAHWSTTADASEDSDNTLTMEPPRRLMTAPMSTIEDSLEEIDQLEDEFEAVAAATRVAQISNAEGNTPGDQAAQYPPSPKPASKTTRPNGRGPSKTTSPVRAELGESSPRSATRKSCPLKADAEPDNKPNLTNASRKVARPASLAPPKPLQRASKAPTIPTFELPGERVARELKEKKAARLSMQADSLKPADDKAGSKRPPSFRSSKPRTIPDFELPGERVARELKEKKAARLSMQVDPQKLAESSPPPQRARAVRSSKPPTVPNFELPGESISQVKKERLAARLKAEEEEMRQRRQFKARPPPSSAGGSATVRSTFTSRQRESQGACSEQQSTMSPLGASPRPAAGKRQSVTMTASVARTVSNASASTAQTNRGRTSSVGSSHFSARATSSSNASIVSAGKRSQVSNEEMQDQKARGRDIYTRDNSYGQDKEREKLERQQAVQLARQKYAEQSRMLAASRRLKQQQLATAPKAGLA